MDEAKALERREAPSRPSATVPPAVADTSRTAASVSRLASIAAEVAAARAAVRTSAALGAADARPATPERALDAIPRPVAKLEVVAPNSGTGGVSATPPKLGSAFDPLAEAKAEADVKNAEMVLKKAQEEAKHIKATSEQFDPRSVKRAEIAVRKADVAWKRAKIALKEIVKAKPPAAASGTVARPSLVADNNPSPQSQPPVRASSTAMSSVSAVVKAPTPPTNVVPLSAKTATAEPVAAKAVPAPAVARAPAPAVTKAPVAPVVLPMLEPAVEDAVPAGLVGRVRKKVSWAQLSFIAAVLVPVLLIGLYYLFVSSDQYRSEMRFAVRGTERSTLENLGLSAIPGATEQAGDAYIVIDYIHSKQVILDIQQKLGIDLRQFFSGPDIDFAYRIDPNMPIDEFISYWRWMVDASYNSTTSITTFEVTAFNGPDAAAIANAVLKVSTELVNDLSTTARLQLISNAQNEVSRTEDRLVTARQAVALFRDTTQITDPTAQAGLELTLIQGLEQQIIEAKSRRAALLSTGAADSPSVRVLDRQIEALTTQLEAKRQVIGSGGAARSGGDRTLTTKLTEYNALALEQEFAEKAYTTALASLETSQAEARRQDRYFAIAVEPNVPEIALHPLRMINTLVAFFALCVIWLIGYLVAQAIRDHTV
ncbi:hypothetical protein [Mesorhizobium sp. IMUNJ 23232]|uniref:hypothetical protein n=1 Tax=Mesorhizobium sp. IMUNJ 23232 TaxID=3376064 RepID=UPI0037964712